MRCSDRMCGALDCLTCHPEGYSIDCEECNGTGKIDISNCCGVEFNIDIMICSKCHEHCDKDSCNECEGTGNVSSQRIKKR